MPVILAQWLEHHGLLSWEADVHATDRSRISYSIIGRLENSKRVSRTYITTVCTISQLCIGDATYRKVTSIKRISLLKAFGYFLTLTLNVPTVFLRDFSFLVDAHPCIHAHIHRHAYSKAQIKWGCCPPSLSPDERVEAVSAYLIVMEQCRSKEESAASASKQSDCNLTYSR